MSYRQFYNDQFVVLNIEGKEVRIPFSRGETDLQRKMSYVLSLQNNDITVIDHTIFGWQVLIDVGADRFSGNAQNLQTAFDKCFQKFNSIAQKLEAFKEEIESLT